MTHRNRERKRRTQPQLALHPDPAPVQLDELPTEGQPQPGALDLLIGCSDLPKFFEHRVLILWRDANTRVGDRHFDHAVSRYCVNVDAAPLRRELDRVREEIEKDLTD